MIEITTISRHSNNATFLKKNRFCQLICNSTATVLVQELLCLKKRLSRVEIARMVQTRKEHIDQRDTYIKFGCLISFSTIFMSLVNSSNANMVSF